MNDGLLTILYKNVTINIINLTGGSYIMNKIYRTCKNCGDLSSFYQGEETKRYFKQCILCGGELRDATPEEAETCRKEDEEYQQRKIHDAVYKTMYKGNYKNAYTPKCPVCGSHNIHKISATKRVVSGAAFGLFSKTARSQWECSNCGNKF